jgi:hypothetical protein
MSEPITELQREPVKDWQVWYGVAAGPVIWAMHLVAVYALQTLACEWGWLLDRVWGMPALRLALIIVTVIAVVAILFGGFLAFANWRLLRDEAGDTRPEKDRLAFMAYSGVGLSLLFATTTALKSVPILVIGICAR